MCGQSDERLDSQIIIGLNIREDITNHLNEMYMNKINAEFMLKSKFIQVGFIEVMTM